MSDCAKNLTVTLERSAKAHPLFIRLAQRVAGLRKQFHKNIKAPEE
jgi:hypothetical protein